MKKIKRISAFVLTLIMLFSMSLSAFADTTNLHTLTIENKAPNHVYDAYQIFAGDLSENDDMKLSNITWGESIQDGDALIQALVSDTTPIQLGNNSTTTLSVLFASVKAACDADTEGKLDNTDKARLVADVLKSVSNDSTTLDRFAEVVGKVIYDESGTFKSHTHLNDHKWTSKEIKNNAGETENYTIESLPAGYYLIKDQDNKLDDTDNEGDFYTKYIVRVVKSASIVAKGEGVKVSKTVNDTIDGTYTKYEDANTNEKIYFKWEGTLPNNLDSYDTYYYKFTDTLPLGLKFVGIEKIYVENENGSVAHTIYEKSESEDIGPNDNNINTTMIQNESTSTITLEFNDLFQCYSNLGPDQKIIVKYSCYLTRDSLISEANSNEVVLEYDNNPNGEGTGKTVKDVAHAFTFTVNIDKYDMEDNTKKLAGVKFRLYYKESTEETTTYYYAKVLTEDMIGQKINDREVKAEDVGCVYGYTTTMDNASILITDEDGAINLKGLDAGYYYLEEIETIDGYNKLDTPVQIQIIPTYTVKGEECSVSVEYEVDGMEQGANAKVGVRNSQGSTLPSTGGIGTTIFYVAGGILVVGAVVILVTKKRMSNEK